MAELTTRYYKTTGTGGEYLVDLFDDNTLWEWSVYEGRESGWGGTWAKEFHLKEWWTVFAIGDKQVRFSLNEGVEDGVWVNLTPVPVLRKVE